MSCELLYAYKPTGRIFIVTRTGLSYSIKDPVSNIFCVMSKWMLRQNFVCKRNHRDELRKRLGRKAGVTSHLARHRGICIKATNDKVLEIA